jgi:hypothetical protein
MSDQMNDDPQPLTARLTRLADDSLPEQERARLRAEVERSSEQAAALTEQQRAVALVRSVEIAAPDALRARAEAMMRPSPARRRPRRPRLAILTTSGALAAVIVALAVVLSVGASAPSVPQAAHVALSAATLPVPSQDPSHADLLGLRVDGIPLPNYIRSIGWEAAGARRDELHGRKVTTVFYTSRAGGRIGYAIVSGAPLTTPAGRVATVGGVRFTIVRIGSARLITWRRSGHTCVIAGRRISEAVLLELAAADERAE